MGKHHRNQDKSHRSEKRRSAKKPQWNFSFTTTAREHPEFDFTKRNIAETAGSLVLLLVACALGLDGWAKLVAFAAVLLAAFYTVLFRAIDELANKNILDECYPVIIASAAAFAIGDYCAGAAVMVFYRVAKLLEGAADRVSRKMQIGMKIELPKNVKVLLEDGTTETVRAHAAEIGNIIEVEPDEMFALDGVIIDGLSAVDISTLTDSADNYNIRHGSHVFSGCVNKDATVHVKITRTFDDSTAQRICHAQENVQRYKTKLEKYVETIEAWLIPAIMLAAILLALIPTILTGDYKEWIGRAAVLLALSNTAVLSASVSLCFLGAVAVLAKRAVFVKGTRFIEVLARTKTMVFNKTGTITEGRYIVTDYAPDGISEYELILTAARAEQYSGHPIGRAICVACGAFEHDPRDKVRSESIPGRGISTFVGDDHIYVGNAALLEEKGVHCNIPHRTGTAIHVALNGTYCGYLILNERVREGAFDTMEELRVLGVHNTVLLTDDVRSIARQVASSVSFDMVKSEQTPEKKVSAVEYLLATKPDRSALAVVCDRASDTEALERADVGISIASLGVPAAHDSADILIMADELRRVPLAMRVSKLAYHAAAQNVIAIVTVKFLLILLGALGGISILPAAVIDIVASAAVLLNAYRTVYNKY